MSHVVSIFGKDLYALTLDDLTSFFSVPQEEGSILEFKSGETNLDSIHKEVCAFLNTDGGVIIWGSPKEQAQGDKKKPKICQGELTDTNVVNQDRIMHSIASNITPAPSNIKIKPIPLKNGYAYVLEVPKSNNSPHQVSTNGVYYMRLEREAKPAPHGFVEALFNKVKPIELKQSIKVNREGSNKQVNYVTYELRIRIANVSYYPAKEIEAYLGIVGYNIDEISQKKDLKRELLSFKYYHLSKYLQVPYTLVTNIWWEKFYKIKAYSDHFYVQLIVLAKDTHATGIIYKYQEDEGLTKCDLYTESDLQLEFKRVFRRKKK